MGSFALDMQKFTKKANSNIDVAVKRIVAGVAENVIIGTPVGDASYWKSPAPKGYIGGRARGSWDYGFNSIPSGADAIDGTGGVSMSRVETGLSMSGTAGVHYLVNGLPYIQRLEDGWSRQAPSGMIGLTVLKWQSIVDDASKGLA